ncbi:MAG: fumarylacetoacetate hydrolase family protein [Deltaproteobacteria bacterium]|nr:fumarylacetoacetate hydrolase family protein [Deltaproteobacteria bacterium]MDZ4340827.1 fumarylacetoacetate hydrolase family protein [Candidatus Binatia bacterium]
MKIVLFGPERRIGAWQGDRVIDLNRALANYLREQRGDAKAQAHADERVPACLEDFILRGSAALEDAARAVEHASQSGAEFFVCDVQSVKLHAPWPERRIACVGGNYAAHLAGMWAGRPGVTGDLGQITRMARDEGQWGFWKNPHEVAGPAEEIPYPNRTKRFDYEGEVAIVIGKRGKNIPADRIDEYVWGVTLFHDWSIRDGGSSGPQGRPISYNLAKNFDGSASIGPCIAVGELDHRNINVETRINGEVRQSYNTQEMIWPFGEVLEYLSQDFTFVPGDVIAGGTSAGTAADMSRRQTEGAKAPNLFLKIGDVVELSSPQIGKLSNRIVAA